jgi:PAS domain S-box-containing protein
MMDYKAKYEELIDGKIAFFEQIIESIPEAIAFLDVNGKIININKEFSTLFGFTKEEALNKFIKDIIISNDPLAESLQGDSEPSQYGKETIKTVRSTKNGNKKNVSLIITPISNNKLNIAYVRFYRDISANKKAQLLQDILHNISTTSLKQFDIADIYPALVKELGRIWDTNNFFIALYKKETETLTFPFFSDEKDKFEEVAAKNTLTNWVIKNNKAMLLREQDITELEEAGKVDLVGTPCKLWMGVPLNVENETIGVMCLQDYYDEEKFTTEDLNVLEFIANQIAISIQRKTMLDNLILARQKAEEAALSKQQFMSTMSHEIRTPLNEVIGITNLLLQENPRDDQMDYIKTLRFSGNHLLTLVNDVLDYNKMELGMITFEKTQFNLKELLDEIMRSYSFRSKEKQLEFEMRKSPDLPVEVIGDALRLNQILSNLLSNALKFTTKGSIHVIINVLKQNENHSSLEFIIRDTGIGIPFDKQAMIFDSFTQASTDTTRRFGGTGLGLSICKKLIELMGGKITVESNPNIGSTFRFTITYGIVNNPDLTKLSDKAETFEELKGKKILVAEDNKINFFVANKFLLGWGVTVTHAENGQLALDILEKEEFDLILMDLHMPILDGIEASRIIRNSTNPKIKGIPIVALTAAIMSESHDRIEGLNINDYVLKPFKPRDLYDKIVKHIL